MAERLRQATMVELDSNDHLAWLSDARDQLIEATHTFVVARRVSPRRHARHTSQPDPAVRESIGSPKPGTGAEPCLQTTPRIVRTTSTVMTSGNRHLSWKCCSTTTPRGGEPEDRRRKRPDPPPNAAPSARPSASWPSAHWAASWCPKPLLVRISPRRRRLVTPLCPLHRTPPTVAATGPAVPQPRSIGARHPPPTSRFRPRRRQHTHGWTASSGRDAARPRPIASSQPPRSPWSPAGESNPDLRRRESWPRTWMRAVRSTWNTGHHGPGAAFDVSWLTFVAWTTLQEP